MTGEIIWENENYAEGCLFDGALGQKMTVLPKDRTDCDEKCTSNDNCTHYNWIPQGPPGTCILRSGLAHRSRAIKTVDQRNVCGIKSPRWEKDNWAFGCDFSTKSTLRVADVASDKCGPECFNDNDCTHYTYSLTTGKCRLMDGDIRKDQALITHDKNMICGVVLLDTIEWQIGNYATFCEFAGRDFLAKPTKVEDCGLECQNSPKCTHFTWIKGICNMKEGKVRKEDAAYKRHKSFVCGFIEGRSVG